MEAFVRRECRPAARPAPGIETELRVGVGRGDYQAHQLGDQLGSPEQNGFIAAAVGVLQDFATPSDDASRQVNAPHSVAQRR
jgi:hypothetical protein